MFCFAFCSKLAIVIPNSLILLLSPRSSENQLIYSEDVEPSGNTRIIIADDVKMKS